MAAEANVIRLKKPSSTIVCHIRVPNVGALLKANADVVSGLNEAAVEMQQVAEKFEDLAQLFRSCPSALFRRGTFFHNGQCAFVFDVPREYKEQLLEMGWTPDEVDVESR